MGVLVWGLEWRLALSSRRDLVMRLVVPLATVLVIATGSVPEGVAAATYPALFLAFGVLGTALAVLHDGERGIIVRVVRAGVTPSSYLMQRAVAGASLAFAQLLPALALAAVFLHASVPEVLVALGALALSLCTGSLLGIVTAAISRSGTEAVVLSGVGLLLLLHMSGVFHTPTPSGFGASLETASPFRMLHEAFVTMVAGGATRGGVAAAVWTVALAACVQLLGPRLTASLER